MIAKILSLALLLLCSTTTLASNVELDTIVMQLRSKRDTDNSQLLEKMLAITTKYLDDYFGAYYASTEPRDYFGAADLEVNSFGVHGVTGSFITTLEFDGKLFFNSDPAPSQSFLNTLLVNAFQGLNLDLYLQSLVSSEDERFLHKLTHIIIEISENTVTDTNLEETDAIEPEGDESDKGWTELATYAVAGVVGALLMLGAFCLFRCLCCKGKRQVDDGLEPISMKSIEIPATLKPVQPESRRSKPLQYKARTSRSNDFFTHRERSPSPVRSLASQDSSKFTYNPAGVSKTPLSLGSLSTVNIDVQNVDLEAWQRQNTITPITPDPFGMDISAIEGKDRDLSLIEEGDEGSRQGGQYRSRKSLSSLEARNSRSRKLPSRAPSQPSIPSRTMEPRGMDFYTEDSSTMDVTEISSDVINDLRNLSLQFDKHRGSRSGR
jgi:hypothetical protein